MGLPKASTRSKRHAARLVAQSCMAKAAATSAESARMAHGRESVRKGFAEGEAARTQAKQATAETLLQAAESDESKAAAAKKLAEARLRAEGTETRFAKAVLERGETERSARVTDAKVHANKMTAISAGVMAAQAGATQAESKAIAARERAMLARRALTDSEIAASTTAALKQDTEIAAAAACQRVKEALEAEALAVQRFETAKHHAEKAEGYLKEARAECHRSERDLAFSETEWLAAKAGVVEAVHQQNLHAELAHAAVNRLVDSEETVAQLARRSEDALGRTLSCQLDLSQHHAMHSAAAQNLHRAEKFVKTAAQSRESAHLELRKATVSEHVTRDQFLQASSDSVLATVRAEEDARVLPTLLRHEGEAQAAGLSERQSHRSAVAASEAEKGALLFAEKLMAPPQPARGAEQADNTPNRRRRYVNLQSPAYVSSPRASSRGGSQQQQQQQQQSPEPVLGNTLATFDSSGTVTPSRVYPPTSPRKSARDSAHRVLSG